MSYNSDSDSDDSNNGNNNNNNNDNNYNNNYNNNKNDMSTMFSPTTTKNYKTVAETNRLGSLLANKIEKLTSERDEWHQQYDNIKGKYDKILKENDLLKLQIKGIATTTTTKTTIITIITIITTIITIAIILPPL